MRPDLLAKADTDWKQDRDRESRGEDEERQRLQACAAPFNEDQIAAVKQACDKRQKVTRKICRTDLIAAAHQQCGAADRERQRSSLPGGRAAMGDAQAVNREHEAARVAEQSGVAKLGHPDAGIPARKVERVEHRCD